MSRFQFLHKRRFLIFFILVCIMLLDTTSFCVEDTQTVSSAANVRGKVTEVLSVMDEQIEYSGGSLDNDIQMLKVRITTKGPFKDKIVEAEYALSLSFSEKQNNTLLKPGDEVLLTLEFDGEENITQAYIYNVARDKYLLLLVLLFAGILLFVGGMKGLRTLITLVLTVFAIIYILLPLILKGFDPVFVSIWVCTAITCVTLLLVSGINKKTLTAIIGTTGGVIAAGFISQIIGFFAKLTGLGDEESQMLLYIPQNISFDFKGLLFAGIIIGALGAAMDVALSLSSAMFEIKEINPKIKRGALIRAGMNIGRDMMATMSNTLILAYVGGSLQMMLLLMAHQIPFSEIINQDALASEVVRSLAGSIGLILTIPVTALAVGFLSDSRDKNEPHY